jgi:hypothetical protein
MIETNCMIEVLRASVNLTSAMMVSHRACRSLRRSSPKSPTTSNRRDHQKLELMTKVIVYNTTISIKAPKEQFRDETAESVKRQVLG